MVRAILPDQPLRLTNRYRNNRLAVILLFASFGVVFLIVGAVFGIRDLRAMAREQHVWDHGVPCESGHYESTFSDETELAITCHTADMWAGRGPTLHGTLTLYNMSYSSLQSEEEIRYDPNDTEEFAIESGIAQMKSRRAGSYGGMTGSLVIALLLFGIGALFWRRLAIARRLAKSGDEAIVHVVRVKTKMRKNIETHMRRVYWKLHPDDKKVRKNWLDAKQGLAWLNSHEPKALALASGNHAILLAGNFQPIEIDDEPAKRAALARLEKDGGGLPRGLTELADWIKLSPPVAK